MLKMLLNRHFGEGLEKEKKGYFFRRLSMTIAQAAIAKTASKTAQTANCPIDSGNITAIASAELEKDPPLPPSFGFEAVTHNSSDLSPSPMSFTADT
jgi:hypothetical protein